MSQFIAKIDVDKYTISFHREGSVWVKAKGVRGVRMLQYMLYDPYDGVSRISVDVLIPFNDYIKYEWLKVCPHMKYAYEKCGDVVTADKMAMIAYVNKYPFLEPLLNNPHNKKYAYFSFMWHQTYDSPGKYENNPAMLKQVIRNFHDPSIDIHPFIPLSKAHEPQYRWALSLVDDYGMDDWTLSEIWNGWFTEKDMKYVIKLHDKASNERMLGEIWDILESYLSYRKMIEDAIHEDLLPYTVRYDPYWVYPSPASYLTRRNRIADILNAFHDGQERHAEFDMHMDRYKNYPVDITVGEFRFYTTTSRETWIKHSDALKQCCYRLKYYSHDNSILTFVEKDGVPYGTIDYSLEEHRVLQARIDQTDYSKSDMPSGVVKLFMKHVICVLENK